jgi:hypothetical protein
MIYYVLTPPYNSASPLCHTQAEAYATVTLPLELFLATFINVTIQKGT